jgi:hypothetical protein
MTLCEVAFALLELFLILPPSVLPCPWAAWPHGHVPSCLVSQKVLPAEEGAAPEAGEGKREVGVYRPKDAFQLSL